MYLLYKYITFKEFTLKQGNFLTSVQSYKWPTYESHAQTQTIVVKCYYHPLDRE